MDRIDKLENKVDKIIDENNQQNITLTKIEANQRARTAIQQDQHESLREHIAASKANGNRITVVEKQAIKDRSFIKGSIWAISAFWGLLIIGVGIYLRLK